MAAAAFAQSREIEYQPIVPRRRQSRRFWSHAMLFVAAVLAVNGLIGERGLLQTLRARRAYAAAAADVERLRQANEALRDRVRGLRSDPATIEAVARRELGLVRPDEILVTVRDKRASAD